MLNYKFLFDTFFVALSGAPITMLTTIVSLLIAAPLAFLFALTRVNEVPVFKRLVQVYVSFIRGTPMIVQIFIIYNSVPTLLATSFTKFGIKINIYNVNPIWYAFIVFSLNTIAILSEVFRSAINTVNKGQLEAAQTVGLTNAQAYIEVIIPQALVAALPNICTATTNLIKGTSLGYAMSLQEITLRAKVAANSSYSYLESYIDIFLVYLILCSAVEYLFKLYERRLRTYKFAKV